MLCCISLPYEIHLVFLWYRVRQDVSAGAGGVVGVSGSTQHRWGWCSCGGLLRMLQLLPVYLPLFGSPVLKPNLYLSLWETQCHWQLGLPPHSDVAVVLKLLLKLQALLVSVHHPVLVLSASLSSWNGRSAWLMRSSPRAEGVLADEVVRGERAPSSGGGRAAQLRGGETNLPGAGAWPREAVRIVLPGSVDRVPGTCRWVTDSRDVMITGKVIRRRNVLTAQWQGLSRESGRLWVVHPRPTGE